MVQRTTLAASSRPPSVLATALLARLATLFAGLRRLQSAGAQDAAASRNAAEDPLALLRPLFAEFIEHPESQAPFTNLLRRVETLVGADASVLLAIGEDGESLHHLADTDPAEHEVGATWLAGSIAAFRATGAAPVEMIEQPGRRVAVRLRDSAGLHGCLVLRLAPGVPLRDEAEHHLRTLAAALGGIVHGVRRARLSRRLALYEERATIARELHDSLAQSLSYLKIQVSRMQALLARHGDPGSPGYAELDAVTQELRANLNLAYRQLRELITTCRLTMNGRTLTQALEDSASEYAGRSTLVVELDNRIGDTALGAYAELQLLQIVREALANVVRHAHARRVQVSLRAEIGGDVRLAVEDDGIGIDADADLDGARHHGLLIMQERAHGLGGELRVEPGDQAGTRVLVRFASDATDSRP